MGTLKKGDKAPAFSALNQDGERVSLEQFKGKKLVIYFYPKDNTPGCTAEACDLRDNYQKFQKEGFEILGVSADSQKSHINFKSKYELPFDLLSDVDKKMLQDYDAWGEKTMYGKSYMGILRKTYILSEEGIIEEIFEKVQTKTHSDQIFEGLNT